MANANRMKRVDSEIQKQLAKIVSNLDDKEISSSIISILKVETASDFSYSKIYVSVLGEKGKTEKIVKRLNENQKTIRYELAHAVKLRIVPELEFVVDKTAERAEKMLKLFEEIEGEGEGEK